MEYYCLKKNKNEGNSAFRDNTDEPGKLNEISQS